ncbi:hypothetical protein Trydic_g13128 [Trypoxylus dichotomus]
MVFVCVRTCTNTNKDQKIYSFPKELEMARRWFVLLGKDDFISKEFKTVRKNYRVFGAHFDSSCMFDIGSTSKEGSNKVIKEDFSPIPVEGEGVTEFPFTVYDEMVIQVI